MPVQRIRSAAALGALAVAAGAATCGRAGSAPTGSAAGLALGSLGFELFIGLAALAAALLAREPPVERLALRPSRLRRRSLLLLALGTLGLSQGLDGVLEWTGLRDRSALAHFEASLAGIRGPTLWLALLGLGIAPGIGEELLCRGLIQKGLERSLGAAGALVVASLAFGALHLEPVHAAFATVLGLYLGLAMLLAASLRAAILCHVVNNLAAVAAAALAPGAPPRGALPTLLGFAVAAACLGAVLRDRASATAPVGEPAASSPGRPGSPPAATRRGLQPGHGSDEPEG